MSTVWTPHLTVAAVIERDGRFLLVEEMPEGVAVFNQPAGHVEEGEPLSEAVVREVAEECCRHFTPRGMVGIYRWCNPDTNITYLRIAFYGDISEPNTQLERDDDIMGERWFSHAELMRQPLRSPLVMRCIDDYLAGQRLPLNLISELA